MVNSFSGDVFPFHFPVWNGQFTTLQSLFPLNSYRHVTCHQLLQLPARRPCRQEVDIIFTHKAVPTYLHYFAFAHLMRKHLSSILVSHDKKQCEVFLLYRRDSWKQEFCENTALSLGINVRKVSVNVLAQHQSPEYRPCVIFRPFVSKVAS